MADRDEARSNKALAGQMLQATLSALSDRILAAQGGPDEMSGEALLPLLKMELEGFNQVWKQEVKRFLSGEMPEVEGREDLRVFGDFTAMIRLPGLPWGPEPGRVPGLQWRSWREGEKTPLSDSLAKLDKPLRWELESAELPFCRQGSLWHLWFPADESEAGAFDSDAYSLVINLPKDEVRIEHLDWSNDAIYRLADEGLIRATDDPYSYVRFFFHLVSGQHGRFMILEKEADLEFYLPWAIDPTSKKAGKERQKIARKLAPLERKGTNPAGETIYSATILFKNALFSSDVALDPSGQMRLENEEPIIEDLSLHDTLVAP